MPDREGPTPDDEEKKERLHAAHETIANAAAALTEVLKLDDAQYLAVVEDLTHRTHLYSGNADAIEELWNIMERIRERRGRAVKKPRR